MGTERSAARLGGSWTALSSPPGVGCEDGNLLIGCPCQETKEERLKCQHLVGKKFLSGTFGNIPRERQLEPRRAEWKGLWLESQTDRRSVCPSRLRGWLGDLRQGT